MSDPVRITLTESQRRTITDSGARFLVCHPASYPSKEAGQHVLDLLPCDSEQANKAVAVAKGELLTRKARKV